MLVGTAELTRLQGPNCALEGPEIFERRIVLIRSVSFPFPDQQHLYAVHRRKNFTFFHSISFLYFINAGSGQTGSLDNYHSHSNSKMQELLVGNNTKC